MSIVLDGTSGITTPAQAVAGNLSYTGTLTGNGGIVNIGSGQIYKDASGNVGFGTTTPNTVLEANKAVTFASADTFGQFVVKAASGALGQILNFGVDTTANISFIQSTNRGTATNDLVLQRYGSNVLVGTTTAGAGAGFATKLAVDAAAADASLFKTSGGSGSAPIRSWNASTTTDGQFIAFATEASYTTRGTITYNRGAGLVAYNVTSDYRAKDIYGPVTGSGALIDSVPVYMGKMKDATQERPMFIAHEVPAYAHTGEKDAVDKDGSPVYQQMDASALIPVMWAEIQSLRKRLAALESK